MDKLPNILPKVGSSTETKPARTSPNFASTSNSSTTNAAKKSVDLLLRLVLIPDHITDTKAFIAKLVQMFAEYPEVVMTKAAHTIPERSSRPTIELIRKVLDELHAPILREEVRQRAHQEARLCLPPPDPVLTEEQRARRAELAREARKSLGIPEEGLPPKGVQPRPIAYADPDYSDRIKADLARRRAINEARAAEAQAAQQPETATQEPQP